MISVTDVFVDLRNLPGNLRKILFLGKPAVVDRAVPLFLLRVVLHMVAKRTIVLIVEQSLLGAMFVPLLFFLQENALFFEDQKSLVNYHNE